MVLGFSLGRMGAVCVSSGTAKECNANEEDPKSIMLSRTSNGRFKGTQKRYRVLTLNATKDATIVCESSN